MVYANSIAWGGRNRGVERLKVGQEEEGLAGVSTTLLSDHRRV
jgi:hypothetical protein